MKKEKPKHLLKPFRVKTACGLIKNTRLSTTKDDRSTTCGNCQRVKNY